jgi:hypothetical protein
MHLNSINKQHYPLSMHSLALQPPLQKEKPNTDNKAAPDAMQRTKNQIYHLINSKIEN